MVQGPNAMQEPSMDELLASIREIIEENTESAPNKNQARQALRREENSPSMQPNPMPARQVRINPSEQHSFSTEERVVRTQERGSRGEERVSHGHNDLSNKHKDAHLNAPPVHDAMNALAARIGLRHNEQAGYDDNGHENNSYDDRGRAPMPPSATVVKKQPPHARVQQVAFENETVDQQRQSTIVTQNMASQNGYPNNGAGQLRNPSEQALQARHSTSSASSSHQPISSQSSVPQNRPESVQPTRNLEQPREFMQQKENSLQRDSRDENNVRNQSLSSGGLGLPSDNRHAPPQPRMPNPVMHPNNIAAQNNMNHNFAHAHSAVVEPAGLYEDYDLNAISGAGASQPPSSSAQANQPQASQAQVMPSQRSSDYQMSDDVASVQSAQASSNSKLNNDAVLAKKHDQKESREEFDAHIMANDLSDAEKSVNNVPYAGSQSQRPHFATQALSSAFMSIPADDSDFQTVPSLPQTPLRPQSVSAHGIQLTRVELKAAEIIEAEVKREMNNLDKVLEADFEKSAENLLRPYIAQWLDKHFSEIFDKILREEIKRVINSQLR